MPSESLNSTREHNTCKASVQFSSVAQSCLTLCDPMDCPGSPCPSATPGVNLNSCPSSRWCHPTVSSSVVPFSSCPQSFPASGSFSASGSFQMSLSYKLVRFTWKFRWEKLFTIAHFYWWERKLGHGISISHLVWPHYVYFWSSKCGPWTHLYFLVLFLCVCFQCGLF